MRGLAYMAAIGLSLAWHSAYAATMVIACGSSPCVVFDGTTQPAGTAWNRIVCGQDNCQGSISIPSGSVLIADTGQTLYVPPLTLLTALQKSALPATEAEIENLQVLLAAASQTASSVQKAIGTTTGDGHTTTAMTLSFATVAVGGTSYLLSNVSDPSTGNQPGIGAKCEIGTNTATPLPLSLLFDCTVTGVGTVSVTALPRAGVALGAQSFTANVFWRW